MYNNIHLKYVKISVLGITSDDYLHWVKIILNYLSDHMDLVLNGSILLSCLMLYFNIPKVINIIFKDKVDQEEEIKIWNNIFKITYWSLFIVVFTWFFITDYLLEYEYLDRYISYSCRRTLKFALAFALNLSMFYINIKTYGFKSWRTVLSICSLIATLILALMYFNEAFLNYVKHLAIGFMFFFFLMYNLLNGFEMLQLGGNIWSVMSGWSSGYKGGLVLKADGPKGSSIETSLVRGQGGFSRSALSGSSSEVSGESSPQFQRESRVQSRNNSRSRSYTQTRGGSRSESVQETSKPKIKKVLKHTIEKKYNIDKVKAEKVINKLPHYLGDKRIKEGGWSVDEKGILKIRANITKEEVEKINKINTIVTQPIDLSKFPDHEKYLKRHAEWEKAKKMRRMPERVSPPKYLEPGEELDEYWKKVYPGADPGPGLPTLPHVRKTIDDWYRAGFSDIWTEEADREEAKLKNRVGANQNKAIEKWVTQVDNPDDKGKKGGKTPISTAILEEDNIKRMDEEARRLAMFPRGPKIKYGIFDSIDVYNMLRFFVYGIKPEFVEGLTKEPNFVMIPKAELEWPKIEVIDLKMKNGYKELLERYIEDPETVSYWKEKARVEWKRVDSILTEEEIRQKKIDKIIENISGDIKKDEAKRIAEMQADWVKNTNQVIQDYWERVAKSFEIMEFTQSEMQRNKPSRLKGQWFLQDIYYGLIEKLQQVIPWTKTSYEEERKALNEVLHNYKYYINIKVEESRGTLSLEDGEKKYRNDHYYGVISRLEEIEKKIKHFDNLLVELKNEKDDILKRQARQIGRGKGRGEKLKIINELPDLKIKWTDMMNKDEEYQKHYVKVVHEFIEKYEIEMKERPDDDKHLWKLVEVIKVYLKNQKIEGGIDLGLFDEKNPDPAAVYMVNRIKDIMDQPYVNGELAKEYELEKARKVEAEILASKEADRLKKEKANDPVTQEAEWQETLRLVQENRDWYNEFIKTDEGKKIDAEVDREMEAERLMKAKRDEYYAEVRTRIWINSEGDEVWPVHKPFDPENPDRSPWSNTPEPLPSTEKKITLTPPAWTPSPPIGLDDDPIHDESYFRSKPIKSEVSSIKLVKPESSSMKSIIVDPSSMKRDSHYNIQDSSQPLSPVPIRPYSIYSPANSIIENPEKLSDSKMEKKPDPDIKVSNTPDPIQRLTSPRGFYSHRIQYGQTGHLLQRTLSPSHPIYTHNPVYVNRGRFPNYPMHQQTVSRPDISNVPLEQQSTMRSRAPQGNNPGTQISNISSQIPKEKVLIGRNKDVSPIKDTLIQEKTSLNERQGIISPQSPVLTPPNIANLTSDEVRRLGLQLTRSFYRGPGVGPSYSNTSIHEGITITPEKGNDTRMRSADHSVEDDREQKLPESISPVKKKEIRESLKSTSFAGKEEKK